MLAYALLPVFLALGAYAFSWLIRWLSAITPLFKKKWIRIVLGILYFLVVTDMYIAYYLPVSRVERVLKMFGNYWYGITIYVTMTLVIADLIRIICKHLKFVNKEKLHARRTFIVHGLVCLLIMATVCIWGAVNARRIHTTSYDVTIDKQAGDLSDLNVVLIADLHMGYNIGVDHIRQMVDRVNAANPDLIVVAGDIFDNNYEALEDDEAMIQLLRSMKSTYGTYAVYGNHDVDEKLLGGFTFNFSGVKESDPRMDEFIDKCGMIRLQDEGVMIDDSFYLYGRPDYEKPGRGITVRKSPEEIAAQVDPSVPLIVIEHEPVELHELAAQGVDMDLCGHTHDGQLFPLTISCDIQWENSAGLLQIDQMHSIVTSGVGLYGPFMRVGTIAEICDIHVHFTK